eukprot:scaffold43858_cov67-Cyclotella_meneghiniana.AAC.6
MKRRLIALASACFTNSASAFVVPTPPINKCTWPSERIHRISYARTALFGTIQFNGKAQADLTATVPQTLYGDTLTSNNRTLSSFLLSSDSDAILLGMKGDGGVAQVVQLDSASSPMSASTWECRQSSLEWFGMTLIPIFTNTLERSETLNNDSDGTVIISIIDATTQVENGGKLGSALASAMRRSEFEGRNIVFWKEEDDANNYKLVGDLELKLTINLPAFLPLPPGFNKIGSRIIERTCRERLRQNLRDISNAYHDWATS